MSDTVYSRQFYEKQSAGSLASARVVLGELRKAVSFKSAVDVGCGVAPWLKVAIELGAERALGVDGRYVEQDHLLVEPALFQPCDLEADCLTDAVGARGPFDLAICMEVAEHLSSERAASFVAELCGLSDLVLFSAAIPGQGGTNHINEQWPGYWSALFDANDFDCFDVLRPRLWEREECEWWYLQNVLLFARRGSASWSLASSLGAPQTAPPMSLVHPRVLPHVVKYAADRIIAELAKHHPFGRSVETDRLEKKLDQLRLMVASRGNEIQQLQEALEGAGREVQRLQGALEAAQGEVAALRGSTSWRVTGPLRRATQLLRR